jgi:hypothetical protein
LRYMKHFWMLEIEFVKRSTPDLIS